jgi:hypothetical protein
LRGLVYENSNTKKEMSKVIIIDQTHYTKSGSIAERTQKELAQKGYSHIWNATDFLHHYNQAKQQARKQRTTLHFGWAALEAVKMMCCGAVL